MGKKYKNYSQDSTEEYLEKEEFQLIKKDLIKVVLLNAFFLALIFGLYFYNVKNNFLDNWLKDVFYF